VYAWSEGLPQQSKDECIVLPWNDLPLLKEVVVARHREIAAIITEPVMCNNGCIPPAEGFLEGLRALCDRYGVTLIFDEVITGFRLAPGGAQQYFNIQPDLSVFAKAMGSGYPVSVIAGKREWMQLLETGRVIQAGTMNAGNAAIAAALATIRVLERERVHEKLFRLGQQLMQGLRQAAAAAGQPMLVQGPGPMFHTAFTRQEQLRDYRDTLDCDRARLHTFIAGMHDAGIRVIGRGLWYISAAHTEADIEAAVAAAARVLSAM